MGELKYCKSCGKNGRVYEYLGIADGKKNFFWECGFCGERGYFSIPLYPNVKG